MDQLQEQSTKPGQNNKERMKKVVIGLEDHTLLAILKNFLDYHIHMQGHSTPQMTRFKSLVGCLSPTDEMDKRMIFICLITMLHADEELRDTYIEWMGCESDAIRLTKILEESFPRVAKSILSRVIPKHNTFKECLVNFHRSFEMLWDQPQETENK